MRASLVAALLLLVACGKPSPAEVADRGWAATAAVVTAGERAATCAAAGVAMRREAQAHHEAFVAAIELDSDRQRFAAAAEYMEGRRDTYRDLETRMEALSERCATDRSVREVFDYMEDPKAMVWSGTQ